MFPPLRHTATRQVTHFGRYAQPSSHPDFYKSMTTHGDHRVWQDVYHGHWNSIALYIKFQRAGEYFVVSLKEL